MLLLLLLLSRFSPVPFCATPQTTAHQAPWSLGFSRQEYCSGLPFPPPMHACVLNRFSCILLCATLWTAAHQAPLSTGFSRQEYWSGLPFPSPCVSIVNNIVYWNGSRLDESLIKMFGSQYCLGFLFFHLFPVGPIK